MRTTIYTGRPSEPGRPATAPSCGFVGRSVLFAYRVWRLPVAALAGTLAGIVAALYDKIYWYPTNEGYAWVPFGISYIAVTAVSSLVVAGLGGHALTRALAQTGVLDRFPAGRERTAI